MTEPPRVTILDFDWPGRELPVMPGDLSQWLPQRAHQAPHREESESDHYGGEYPGTGPILDAPGAQAGGGLLYFDDPDRPGALGKLCGALELMGVYLKTKTYAVFGGRRSTSWTTVISIRSAFSPITPFRISSRRTPKQTLCSSSRCPSTTTSRRSSPSSKVSGTTAVDTAACSTGCLAKMPTRRGRRWASALPRGKRLSRRLPPVEPPVAMQQMTAGAS